jgi:hypothetical protein
LLSLAALGALYLVLVVFSVFWRSGVPHGDPEHASGVVIHDAANRGDAVSISNRHMRCEAITPKPETLYTSAAYTSRCSMTLDGKPLQVFSSKAISNLGFCNVIYDGQPLRCTIAITLDLDRRWADVDAPAGTPPAWFAAHRSDFLAENVSSAIALPLLCVLTVSIAALAGLIAATVPMAHRAAPGVRAAIIIVMALLGLLLAAATPFIARLMP